MSFYFSINAGAGATNPNAANILLRAGVCSLGTNYALTACDPGQDPAPSIGYGPLAEVAAQASRLVGARQYLLKIPATTAGVISSVTKSPSNSTPTIVITGSDFDSVTGSPFVAVDCKIKVTKGGPVGVAVVDVALDGGGYAYTFAVPPETKATLDGTVDLTTLNLSDLDTLHLKITANAGGAHDLTLSTPASVAELITTLDGTANISASLVRGKYLRLQSDTVGSTSSLTIDATGLAAAVLGFTAGTGNLTATGSASKISLPGTGLLATFPSSADYVVGTIESFTATAPRHSQADLDLGLATANADPLIVWGLLEVVQDPIDAPDLRAYANDLDAVAAGWEAQEDKRFVPWIMGAPITVADQAIKDAMAGHQSRYGSIAAGDLFLTGAGSMAKGSHRRSACRALGIRLAAFSLSEDPGNATFGSLPEASMKSPSGVAARNESSSAVKLGGSKGPGFTVVKAKDGLPYFVRGVTRAGQSSIFVDIGVQRMAAYAATAIFALLRRIENPTFDLNEDGTLQEADAAALETSFETELNRLLVQAKHASAVQVTINRAEKVSQTRNITVAYKIQIRGQAEDITGVETLVNELTIPGIVAQAA